MLSLVRIYQQDMFKKAILFFFSLVFACFLGEALLRWLGYQPYQLYDLEITFHPSPFAIPHSQLGYILYPGKFEVQFKNSFSWSATHNTDSFRITSTRTYLADTLAQLFVYGCSVAYGYGIADSLAFPYVLQQKQPGWQVKNYAVPGFAQTQAYLQLKQSIAQGNVPEIVVLTYASFHDIRNTLCRERRKNVYPYNKKTSIDHIVYPVAHHISPDSFAIHYENFLYRAWPLMHYSAFVHLLETQYNEYEIRWRKSHEVSKILIKTIQKLCAEHQIQYIVAGIQNDAATQDMLAFCMQEGIENVDISFDSNDPSYTLLPFDPHPNAKGHTHFAERLLAYLHEERLSYVW